MELDLLDGSWVSLLGIVRLVAGFAAAWVIVALYYRWMIRGRSK